MDPGGHAAARRTRRGDIAARPRLRHRARHDRIIDQLRRRRRAHGRAWCASPPASGRRRRHAHAHRHLAGDGRRHAAADAQPARRVRALQRSRSHDQRDQSAHGRPARAGAGQSPGDGGLDAHDESDRGHRRVLERGADELVRAPHGPAPPSSGGCSTGLERVHLRACRSSRTTTATGATSSTTGSCRRTCRSGPVTGCELYGVSAGRDTDQVAMAHEIGHGAGLQHAPCGLPRFLLVTSGRFLPHVRGESDHRRRLSGLRAVRSDQQPDRLARRVRARHHERHHPSADREGLHVLLRAGVDLALSPREACLQRRLQSTARRRAALASRRTSSIRTCGHGSTSPIRPAGMAAREICG